MTKNEAEVLRISRRLTPEHRAELLYRVRLACREEEAGGGRPGEPEDADSRMRGLKRPGLSKRNRN